MKDQNYENADLKWSMLLKLQQYVDNYIFHECLLLSMHKFSVVVKDCVEICNIGSN